MRFRQTDIFGTARRNVYAAGTAGMRGMPRCSLCSVLGWQSRWAASSIVNSGSQQTVQASQHTYTIMADRSSLHFLSSTLTLR
jgi:hypothetical protein